MTVISKPIIGRVNQGSPWSQTPLIDRFEEKYIPEPNCGCWLWIGAISQYGYGRMLVGGRLVLAHRFSYQTYKGPLIQGLELDHLCRMRCCVNPDHLEQVEHIENVRRGAVIETHCKWGHPWDEKKTWMNGKWRFCRACNNARQKQTQLRKKTQTMEIGT
jgi:HNH endonuclease